jgi:prepilin-type N-terminal cleavage/methylation domain-containing protein
MTAHPPRSRDAEAGFTLVEVIISMGILLVVSAVVMSGVSNMSQLSMTMTNRSDMFAAIRNASALLQQEVGQAGRVSLPGNVTLTGAVAGPGVATVAVSSGADMFVGEWVDVGAGQAREVVRLTAVNGNNITADFGQAHAAGAGLFATGGFSAGVVPPAVANGSTAWVLKIFGDINGNGNMVYVEYVCDIANGRLTRNSMAWNAVAKPAPTVDQILVDDLQANPNNEPCFVYQTQTVSGTPYVTGVAITLTVQSRDRDPVTRQFQRESKALLNVAPRNVFNVWQMASLQVANRIQPTPAQVTALLPAL